MAVVAKALEMRVPEGDKFAHETILGSKLTGTCTSYRVNGDGKCVCGKYNLVWWT